MAQVRGPLGLLPRPWLPGCPEAGLGSTALFPSCLDSGVGGSPLAPGRNCPCGADSAAGAEVLASFLSPTAGSGSYTHSG